MSAILYARVSTVEQTIEHQLSQAKGAGFVIDEVIADNGVSGIATRLIERPEGRRLFDKLRAGDTLVVRWLDRLGRNYEDVCDAIREFMRRGVVIRTVINNFTFDGATRDPMQQAVRDALIGFMAATAQAQAEATKAAQRAGIEHAKAKDGVAYLGRKPSYSREQFRTVSEMIGHNAVGIARIVKETGLTRQTVYRIKERPAPKPRWQRGGCDGSVEMEDEMVSVPSNVRVFYGQVDKRGKGWCWSDTMGGVGYGSSSSIGPHRFSNSAL
jgi:putative DNA-invertase from lambdoid prophage Rac